MTTTEAVVRLVVRLALTVVIARLVTPEEFGLFGAAVIVADLLSSFAGLGLAAALVQRRGTLRGATESAFGLALLLAAVMSLLLWLGRHPVAGFFGQPAIIPLMALLVLAPPLRAFADVTAAVLSLERKYGRLSFIGLTSFLLGYGVVTIVLASIGWGALALTVGFLVELGFRCVLSAWVARSHLSIGLDRHAARVLLADASRFSAGTLLVGFLGAQGDEVAVGRYFGADVLGLYRRAHQLTSIPVNIIRQALGQVLFPVFVSVKDDSVRLLVGYRRARVALATIVLPVSGIGFVYAEELVAVLLGPVWSGVVPLLTVGLCGLYLQISAALASSCLLATGMMSALLRRQAVFVGVLIGAMIVSKPLGPIGMAVVAQLAWALFAWLVEHQVARVVPLTLGQHWADLRFGMVTALATVLTGLPVSILLYGPLPALGVLAVGGFVAGATALACLRYAPGGLWDGEMEWWFQRAARRVPLLRRLRRGAASA